MRDPLCVMVIGGDFDLSHAIVGALRTHGHVVELVPDGESAAELALRWSPEALVLDARSFVGDLALTVRRLRARVAAATSIIVLGGVELEHDDGADLMLTAPLDVERLASLIEYMTRRRAIRLRGR